jgi:hypothetical protein
MKLAEVRKQYPQYDALSDNELAHALHDKFYSQLDFKDFSKRIGYVRGAFPEEYDSDSPEWRKKYGALSGSDFQNFRAGWGKAAVDLGRGAGQWLGLVSREDVANSRERDQELMSTKAGRGGSFAGSIANAVPAAFVPGANTLAGSAAIGAGLGALQPSVSTGETAGNIGLGAATGPASLLAGRGIAAGYRGGKSLIEPFTKGGQERIAGRTLTAFAGGPKGAQAAINAIDNATPPLPGAQPTAAELANNAGLAQLERTLKNNPELATKFSDRSMANKNAILNALDDIAGDSSKMTAARSAREAAASPLYDAAKNAKVKTDSELGKLLARPSMTSAWGRAEKLAAEGGDQLGKPGADISGKTLHYLKMAMDDIADDPKTAGIGAHEARAVVSTRNKLVEWIDKNIPEYKAARDTFKASSRPINQMQVGKELRDKLQPALADFGANTRIRPQAFAQAMREGDDLAASATGFSGAKMADVMDPSQMRSLNQVGEQLARRANADELGRATGSNTGQNIVSQNVLRQFLGPFGLPESSMQRAAESTLMQSVMRPAQFAGKLGEERVLQRLAAAGLDPKEARRLLELGLSENQIMGFLKYQGLLAPAAVSGTNTARQ